MYWIGTTRREAGQASDAVDEPVERVRTRWLGVALT
jgi:hypothetical protein